VTINVNFQNLAIANSEVLKAFNSANAAKALEAYQPLDIKQRKLEKLRALQILKQSSSSPTLADITLSADSLSIALGKAEGATLQAMLNLLSAKMIEQNKYTVFSEDKQAAIKQRIIDKVEALQHEKNKDEGNQEKRKQKSENLVLAIKEHFSRLKEQTFKAYSYMLDVFSLKKLQAVFDEGVELFTKYVNDNFIDPVLELPQKIKNYVDNGIRGILDNTQGLSLFTAEDIRAMLNKPFTVEAVKADAKQAKLESAVAQMDRGLRIYKQKTSEFKEKMSFSKDDVRLVLHNMK
jgi:hypothetical protein